ncbi:hypothetical protein KTS45_18670 [Halomicroarcula limicola]|uniref:Restriction endonuclease type IV Mrr domain-containing protein n=1 Tax=Haloarcula limicola TaxID=1429915 RepID=A0A8J7Y7P3_9EURY|nr:hypothetical protein [Halomicroarcula limicola]MBV0926235.1 hypothetical protein [Halomicroarcula limicola]
MRPGILLPSWYHTGDVRQTVHAAAAAGIETDEVASVLSDEIFDDIPLQRVKSIVEAIPTDDDQAPDVENSLSQAATTDAAARPPLANRCTVTDLEYLSAREAARIVGLVLELFDGNTLRPPATESVEADLLWRRQYMNVGLKIIPQRTTVGVESIEALRSGQLVPDDLQRPSELAIVTSGRFDEEILAEAANNDIHCFDAGHVEEWLLRAQLSPDIVGTLLENGENHDGPLTDLVDVPPIPAPRTSTDPLEIERAFDVDSYNVAAETTSSEPQPQESGTTSAQSTGETSAAPSQTDEADPETVADPLAGSQPPPGKTGTLYADPDEDGEYTAFDDYLDDL